VGSLAQKKSSQPQQRSDGMPTARLGDGEEAGAAAAEESFERPPGIEHDHRHVVPAPRQRGGQQGELALAAADGQIANEEQELHARPGRWTRRGEPVATFAMCMVDRSTPSLTLFRAGRRERLVVRANFGFGALGARPRLLVRLPTPY